MPTDSYTFYTEPLNPDNAPAAKRMMDNFGGNGGSSDLCTINAVRVSSTEVRLDKTFDEVKAAYDEGLLCIIKYGKRLYQLHSFNSDDYEWFTFINLKTSLVSSDDFVYSSSLGVNYIGYDNNPEREDPMIAKVRDTSIQNSFRVSGSLNGSTARVYTSFSVVHSYAYSLPVFLELSGESVNYLLRLSYYTSEKLVFSGLSPSDNKSSVILVYNSSGTATFTDYGVS